MAEILYMFDNGPVSDSSFIFLLHNRSHAYVFDEWFHSGHAGFEVFVNKYAGKKKKERGWVEGDIENGKTRVLVLMNDRQCKWKQRQLREK
jgi:hypothetical protein